MDAQWQQSAQQSGLQSAQQAPGKEHKYINKKRNLLNLLYIYIYIYIYISLIEATVFILLMKLLSCK